MIHGWLFQARVPLRGAWDSADIDPRGPNIDNMYTLGRRGSPTITYLYVAMQRQACIHPGQVNSQQGRNGGRIGAASSIVQARIPEMGLDTTAENNDEYARCHHGNAVGSLASRLSNHCCTRFSMRRYMHTNTSRVFCWQLFKTVKAVRTATAATKHIRIKVAVPD